MGYNMLARLVRTAPALAVAALQGACCLFASDLPMRFAPDTSVVSLQTAPTVVEPTTSKPGKTSPPRRQDSEPLASCRGDTDCARILAALINDPKRGWLGQPQSAAEYANGTRFFAYRALRHTLTCRELILASQDLTIAADRLRAPDTAVSAARAASALSLSTAIASELRNEISDRC
jgi:hypothetical protein